MNDVELAKEVLINNNIFIKAHPVIINGKLSQQPAETVITMNNFSKTKYLKFNIPIEIKELFQYIKPKSYLSFTNWHIENQDMKRINNDFYIWDNNKIYKNELIQCFITNYTIKEFYKNPFENMKTLYAEATLTIRISEPVAKIILPQLKEIYLIFSEIQ